MTSMTPSSNEVNNAIADIIIDWSTLMSQWINAVLPVILSISLVNGPAHQFFFFSLGLVSGPRSGRPKASNPTGGSPELAGEMSQIGPKVGAPRWLHGYRRGPATCEHWVALDRLRPTYTIQSRSCEICACTIQVARISACSWYLAKCCNGFHARHGSMLLACIDRTRTTKLGWDRVHVY
jgi:hypothetical protein